MAEMYVDKVFTHVGTSGMLVRFLGSLWSIATEYIAILGTKDRENFIMKHCPPPSQQWV
jgi:hypothetical protein